ncbi:MAG: DUF4412 domain-containing protein [Saprospiraceae bacterium]|nr:DUF4412 domain-containing protein [Saprospiraceae bacterium]
MRNFILLFVAVLLMGSQAMAQKFEGVVKLKSKGELALNADFTLKGDKVKTEITQDGQEVIMIADKSSGDVYVLSDNNGQKSATKMNMNDIPSKLLASAEVKDEMVVTVTGEKKKVNGYNCVKVIGKSSTVESEAWVTEEVKLTFADLMPGKQGVTDQVLKSWTENDKVKGFPVNIKSKNLTSNVETEYDVEVDAKKIKDKEFEIDPSYQVRDASQFMKMMEKAPSKEDIDAMRARVKEMEQKANAAQMKPLPTEDTKETPAQQEAKPAGDGGGK